MNKVSSKFLSILHATCVGTLLLGLNVARADDQCDLNYRVTPRYDTKPRRLDVEVSFPAEGRNQSWLRLQIGWAGIDDFGAALSPSPAETDRAKLIPTDDSYRWKVLHPPEGRVRVNYQILAALDDPDDGKVQEQEQMYRAQLGANWFQFFGYSVFPSVEAWGDNRKGRMCLAVAQPVDQIGPLFGSYFNGQVNRLAEIKLQGTHELLRHSFYAGGPGWRVMEKKLSTGPIVFGSRGQQVPSDVEFAERASQLIEAHRRFWGDKISSRQTIVRTPNNSHGNSGGTLVHHTAVLHLGKSAESSKGSFESLISHEDLHQWLPNRLGGHDRTSSAAQAARDYWLSEGFTEYYSHRLMLSAGLWTLENYAEQLTRMLRTYWRSPARNATAESIAPRFFSDRDAGRQMYARGEMLAMGWDRELRASSPSGLDGVLRGLLLAPEKIVQAEPARDRVLRALTTELGQGPRAQVQAYIMEGRSFDLDESIAGPCFALSWIDLPRWVMGFDPASFTKRVAIGVVPDGPAHRAGLRDGMPLEGWSVFGGDTGKEVVLTIKSDEGGKVLRYLPVDGSDERLPTLAVRAGAATSSTCQYWMRR